MLLDKVFPEVVDRRFCMIADKVSIAVGSTVVYDIVLFGSDRAVQVCMSCFSDFVYIFNYFICFRVKETSCMKW